MSAEGDIDTTWEEIDDFCDKSQLKIGVDDVDCFLRFVYEPISKVGT